MSVPAPGSAARRVVARTAEIAAVPAPTGEEAARAAVVARWWRKDGWGDVAADATGNVWARARAGEGGAIVIAAHLDTVFPADLPHLVAEERGRLVGPGVGDDAVALAALSEVGALLGGAGGRPVWLLATTGEEGLGNLSGAIGALEGFAGTMDAFIALEGNYLGRVSAAGVGSLRWRVAVSGPGGHTWEAAEAPSAVHAAAGMIRDIARLTAPSGRSAVNVGRVGGGEAVNARARACWFDLDLRASEPGALTALEAQTGALIQTRCRAGIEVAIEELGRRPAGQLAAGHPLIEAAVAALRAAGIAPALVATSTDANAAHARGIPAVALGITTGSGEHTPQEWIDIAPIGAGLSVLAATISGFEEAMR